ncbi:hypothetical protein CJ030_MR3G018310 [Morella rubra]|uniref:Uncharacterized protein n=1 Tax=Morella rubra TaxID=262757 RepID=A0A6A1WB28_9ROSI|nr:hypothetical protein CJ030_MR3G018310 [Morella rubra]
MSSSIVVKREIKLADSTMLHLRARDIEEPSMEVTVRNIPITFSSDVRVLVAFSNLPMSKVGRPTKAKLTERMQSMMRPTHEMVSDISGRLTTLEHKVMNMDFERKKEVAMVQEAMKRVATSAELFALT